VKYKLVVFDIDGTLTTHISSWRLIHEKLGLWDILAKKYQEQFIAGKISYKKFCELDAAHWKGISEQKLINIFKKVKYTKNAKKAIGLLKKKGFRCVAVSTGLQFMTDRIKEEMNFDYVTGNRLVVRKGVLTGGVKINLGHGEKGKVVRKILQRYKIKPSEMIAVGDTEGDIPMIKLAGYSIAFNSSSEELSHIVDHDCRESDFMAVAKKILEVNK
jgi:phosphoserine phosphatase